MGIIGEIRVPPPGICEMAKSRWLRTQRTQPVNRVLPLTLTLEAPLLDGFTRGGRKSLSGSLINVAAQKARVVVEEARNFPALFVTHPQRSRGAVPSQRSAYFCVPSSGFLVVSRKTETFLALFPRRVWSFLLKFNGRDQVICDPALLPCEKVTSLSSV